jgi:cytochrome-b5 reductase
LIFGNVTKGDILLEKDLEDLVARYPQQFDVYHVLNEAPDSSWNQGIGFITKEILDKKMPKPASDIQILVCGPPLLVKSVTNVSKFEIYDVK